MTKSGSKQWGAMMENEKAYHFVLCNSMCNVSNIHIFEITVYTGINVAPRHMVGCIWMCILYTIVVKHRRCT